MPEFGALDDILVNLVYDYPNQSTYWYANAAGIEPSMARRRLMRLARSGHITWRYFLTATKRANFWGTSRDAMTVRVLQQREPDIEWAS